MYLEQSFRAYFAAFDGIKKDFSEVKHLFDATYHDDFIHEMDGNPVNKEQLSRIQANYLSIGTKATLMVFVHVAPNWVEYKLRIVNEKVNLVIHNLASIKENKIYQGHAVSNESVESIVKIRNISNIYSAEKKIQAYIDVYDGRSKSFQEIEKA